MLLIVTAGNEDEHIEVNFFASIGFDLRPILKTEKSQIQYTQRLLYRWPNSEESVRGRGQLRTLNASEGLT